MGTANVLEQAIETMPRGGPEATWLDRRFQTDALEYLDRDDVPDEVKQKVIGMLDRLGTLTNQHENYARTALELVAHVPNPRILELGAGQGKLSAQILDLHPTATVTVSDLDPTSVANIATGELGNHPRARTQVVDATAIDAPDGCYDLVVFALAFHHLPPAIACRAIAEATRVGKRFLVIDLKRRSPLRTLLFPVTALPISLALMPWSWIWPGLHDGFISALRAYSLSALETLGRAADPGMRIETLPAPTWFGPPSNTVVFSRAELPDHD
ncbi:type 11 methyltransferase [Mycobacterium lentiflavum]|uniref:Type 11 methyltransferase n=1 Tax=Mycobacterium lentiflavum TaxID=141349 RepID=A0A0E3WCL0_MYCLN|nr:class I SAM-dependent methyltransferase [Mycobacterium lentiflavum]CQD14716.1 type 11 methyltransferase [Mycobacterium lentiflavum]